MFQASSFHLVSIIARPRFGSMKRKVKIPWGGELGRVDCEGGDGCTDRMEGRIEPKAGSKTLEPGRIRRIMGAGVRDDSAGTVPALSKRFETWRVASGMVWS